MCGLGIDLDNDISPIIADRVQTGDRIANLETMPRRDDAGGRLIIRDTRRDRWIQEYAHTMRKLSRARMANGSERYRRRYRLPTILTRIFELFYKPSPR